MDTARSELPRYYVHTMIITQTPTELTVKRTINTGQSGPVATLRLNRWGPASEPRYVGENVKLVQSRWEGVKLITVAGPGMSDNPPSWLDVWSLAAAGNELTEDHIGTGFPADFDFRESSIPRAYARDRRIYVKSTP